MSDWQPIETAPTDGTWFVIINVDDDPIRPEVGRYDPLMMEQFEEAEGGLYRKIKVVGYEWEGFNNMHRATHWWPLPAPPNLDAG